MNVMVRPRSVADPTGRVAATVRPLDGSVLLGMPQLSGTGLSENWLLKELGHRHWMGLAETCRRRSLQSRQVRVVDLLADRTNIAIRAGPMPNSALMARKLGSTRILIVAAPAGNRAPWPAPDDRGP